MTRVARNSARVTFDLAAVQELIATLKDLGDVDKSNVLAEMVREGAKPVVRSIKSFVKSDSGNLKASIGSVVRKRKRKGTAFAVIGPMRGTYVRTKGDSAAVSDPSRYGHLVEFGFVHAKSGKQVKAQPFMRPGTEAGQANSSALMVLGFQRGMTKVLARHSKKISKKTSNG